MYVCKALTVHLSGQENSHGSAIKRVRIEQMATPILSKLMLARQMMLQVCEDVEAGLRPSPKCPILTFTLLNLPHCSFLQIEPPSPSYPPLFCYIPFNSFLPSLLQTKVGHIHRLGEWKSTAAKERADICVSLRGLSRWLFQQVTASCCQEIWQIKKRLCDCNASPTWKANMESYSKARVLS